MLGNAGDESFGRAGEEWDRWLHSGLQPMLSRIKRHANGKVCSCRPAGSERRKLLMTMKRLSSCSGEEEEISVRRLIPVRECFPRSYLNFWLCGVRRIILKNGG